MSYDYDIVMSVRWHVRIFFVLVSSVVFRTNFRTQPGNTTFTLPISERLELHRLLSVLLEPKLRKLLTLCSALFSVILLA